MNVAVVAGVVVRHDAISSAVAEQIDALRSLPGVSGVRLFTHGLDREIGCDGFVLGNPWELVRHPEFRSCDVAIFHWGIRFALFDALPLMGFSGLPRAVVHFHNCTPPELVEERDRENLMRSIEQFHHAISLGLPLWTYSEFNRRTLLAWGADESQIEQVTFPIPLPPPGRREAGDDRIELLSVGRLVPAKGVHVLIEALTLLPPELMRRLRVRIVSSTTFSSLEYRDTLIAQLRASSQLVARAVEFVTAPSDEELAAMYADADVVVSTSFHEGLCVPVIEGYSAGCRAIGTTAGNLPYVVLSPDPVVEPGDAAQLAAAIERVACQLEVSDEGYQERRRELVALFSRATATRLLRQALFRAAVVPTRDVRDDQSTSPARLSGSTFTPATDAPAS